MHARCTSCMTVGQMHTEDTMYLNAECGGKCDFAICCTEISLSIAGSINMQVVKQLFDIFDKDGNGAIDEGRSSSPLCCRTHVICVSAHARIQTVCLRLSAACV